MGLNPGLPQLHSRSVSSIPVPGGFTKVLNIRDRITSGFPHTLNCEITGILFKVFEIQLTHSRWNFKPESLAQITITWQDNLTQNIHWDSGDYLFPVPCCGNVGQCHPNVGISITINCLYVSRFHYIQVNMVWCVCVDHPSSVRNTYHMANSTCCTLGEFTT